MKILFIGDPHTKLSNLDVSQEMYSLALKRAIEYKCDKICDLGDTFDNYHLIQSQCLRVYLNFAAQVRASNIELIKIIGNHDYETQDCKHHSFEFLKHLDMVTVVDDTYVFDKVAFIPFYRKSEDFLAAVKEVSEAEYLVCHQGFNGYDYGNGYIAKDDIDLCDSQWGFKRIVSGHFHKPAGEIYVGTPFSHSFGESNQIKRFVALDTETNEWTDIPITELPKHITLNVGFGDEGVSYDPLGDVGERDNIRVIVTGTKEQNTSLSDDEIVKVYDRDVTIRRVITTSDTDTKISENLSKKGMIKSYFDLKQIESETALDRAYSYLDEVGV